MTSLHTALDRILKSLSETVGSTLVIGDYYASARAMIEGLSSRTIMVEPSSGGCSIAAITAPCPVTGGPALFADTYQIWIRLDLETPSDASGIENLDDEQLLDLPVLETDDGLIEFAAGVTFGSKVRSVRVETPTLLAVIDRKGKVERL